MTDKVDYAPILQELERRRDEIDQAIMTLRKLQDMPSDATAGTGQRVTVPSTNGVVTMRPDQFFGMKSPEAVKAYLATVKEPRAATEIADALTTHGFHTSSANPGNMIRTTLMRLAGAGEVVKMEKGKKWGLMEWYPGLRSKRGKREESAGETEASPASKKKRSGYHAFLSERMRQGVKMKQAAEEWRQQKKQGGG